MRSVDVFRTRSYRMQPFATLRRGAEWMLRSLLGASTSFPVNFGAGSYRLELQAAKRGFGSAGIFVQRRYYEPLLEFGYKLLDKGDCAIDGGANQGIFTCAFASAVGSTGHVYAFEPQAYAVSCIHRNMGLNAMNNVTVFEGALSDATGETFLVTDRGPVAAFTSAEPQGAKPIRVKSFSIDGLASSDELRDAQFIKLDVEGAELKALRGARSMVRRAKPRICAEVWSETLYDEIERFLQPLGYKTYVFNESGDLTSFTAFHPSPNVFFIC
jgi:FkbM family methyltransferase